MKIHPKTPAGRRDWMRGLAGFAGMAVACAVLASVTVLFDQASEMPWLPETPSNVAAMQRCDGVQGTAAKRACAESVVAGILDRNPAARLAQSDREETPPERPAPASVQ